MGKLTRGAYRLYVDTTMASANPSWYVVGKDIEELTVDLGADTETVKNILDETSVRLNGFEPTIEATPFYADPDDDLYEQLKDIAMNRKKGGDCLTKYLEVVVESSTASSHSAWVEDCYLVPQSVGGDTSGMQIPFNILPAGNRKAGTVGYTNGVPTFTPAT